MDKLVFLVYLEPKVNVVIWLSQQLLDHPVSLVQRVLLVLEVYPVYQDNVVFPVDVVYPVTQV